MYDPTSRRGFLSLTGGLALSAFALGAHAAAPAPAPVSVTDDGLVGIFYPAAPTPGRRKASVLMLGGSGGGFPYADAAADLAAAGYPTLALAYFQTRRGEPKGLPPGLLEIPLEYHFKGIDWLRKTTNAPVALMGESRGGELVLLLASHRPDLAGVIAYSPSNAVWSALTPGPAKSSWTLGGQPLPFLTPHQQPGDMKGMFETALDETPASSLEAALIPVERITGPVLLVSSRADRLWPSSRMADAVEARLKRLRPHGKVENRQYDDASHLLMGFGPAETDVSYGSFTLRFGGTAAGTLAARTDAWAHSKAWLAAL